MGCGSCSTVSDSTSTTPKGCKSNGTCGTSGCNKMNVHDWLASITMFSEQPMYDIVEVSFRQGSRKEFCKNNYRLDLYNGDIVVVDTATGYDIGEVTLLGELVKLQMKKKKILENSDKIFNIKRIANDNDKANLEEIKKLEKETMVMARVIARDLNLNMKIGDVEFQGDKKKATFYYTADERVDFRELIKSYAQQFKIKIEMRQIGSRQESGRIGGIGSCGRELCCSTWLSDFKTVTTNAARYQNLSINQTKLSGQCGRLKCCLNYELDTYMDALQHFPDHANKIETNAGIAYLQKTDIFKQYMIYAYEKQNTQYSLSIDSVKKILQLNKEGKKPEDLASLQIRKEVESGKKEHSFTELVGDVSLRTLEKTKSKPKKKFKNRRK